MNRHCNKCGHFSLLKHQGQAPAVSVVVIVIGTGMTDSTVVREGLAVTIGAARTRSPKEASAESHWTVVAGAETVVM